MPDEQPHNRRWEDVERMAQVAARQEITPVRLTVDRIEADVRDLKGTVYGNPVTRQRGMVDRLEQIEERITQLGDRLSDKIAALSAKIEEQIDQCQARGNQIVGARKALYILAAAIMFAGGLPALAAFLKALGIMP